MMFRQQDNPVLSSLPEIQKKRQKTSRSLYTILAVLGIIIVITTVALLISQNNTSPRELNLNYVAGERMVYENTKINKATDPDPIYNKNSNSTLTLEVLKENKDSYTIKKTGTITADLSITMTPLTQSIDKASYYNNFVDPEGQFIFSNADNNPTLLAYLAQDKITIGDVWTIPINMPLNTGGSIWITGEVTLKFAGTQEITTPAGTFQTMRVEVTSNGLRWNTDDPLQSGFDGRQSQINGTSYVELGTFRAVKADLTQISADAQGSVTGTVYSETILVEYTKP